MEYLSRKGVSFVEKNIGRDPAARQELMELGVMSLPVLRIGDQTITGFNPPAIDAALKAAGL